MSGGVAIIGAGLAAAELVRNLQHDGFSEPIRLFGREEFPPYDRPPLSKAFLHGVLSVESLFLQKRETYEQKGIELLTGCTVDAIDRVGKTIRLKSGEIYNFDICVLATGSHARLPDIEGIGLKGVHVLRTIEDAIELRAALKRNVHLVVVGGGYIGLEVAGSARAAGVDVTLLEGASALMQRSVSALTASAIQQRHRLAGVRILLDTTLRSINGRTRVEAVTTSHGDVVEADAVLVAIGAQPTIELATFCGLDCENGVLVDAQCRSSAPDIYAIGDCAAQLHIPSGHHQRLEAVSAAVYHSRCVAAHLLGKPPPSFRPLTFWSEQHDHMLQMLGTPMPGIACRDVLRGDTATSFSVYRFQDDELVAVEAVNRPKDLARSRGLIGQRNIAIPVD